MVRHTYPALIQIFNIVWLFAPLKELIPLSSSRINTTWTFYTVLIKHLNGDDLNSFVVIFPFLT